MGEYWSWGTRLTDTEANGWLHEWLARHPNGRQMHAWQALRAEGYAMPTERWSRLWGRRDVPYSRLLAWVWRLGCTYPDQADALQQLAQRWYEAHQHVQVARRARLGGPHAATWQVRLEERTEALRLAGLVLGDPGLLGDAVAVTADRNELPRSVATAGG